MLGGRAARCHTFAVLATRTFLFSDLREYTAFVERHGDVAARELIESYRRIVRAEIAKHEGAEIKTEGDSFYVVFSGTRAAVSAALAILREADRYSAHRPERPMRIGIGVHAGEPVPHEGQYVGSAVIVAARLAQTAAAGELLVTDVVRGLLPRDANTPMEERAVSLKGIANPPLVYAVRRADGPARERAVEPGVVIAAAPPVSRQILSPAVIGRDRELATLEALLTEARAGRGRTVLVAGEAGLGKSALLRLFAARARATGARVLVGECTEIEARRPFGPFIDALAGGGLEPPEALGRGGPGAQLLEEAERYRVHARFALRIGDAAAAGPVVVVVEDLHWGDEATYELFPYLARKLRDRPVLLLATYRSDELHRTHPLNHVLAELARGRLAEEIRLKPLTIEELGDVIRLALGLSRPPTAPFRQALYERTEGNPFFLEEILRALVDNGELEYRDGAWRRTKDVSDLAIPVSIRDAVQQRLMGIPETARRVIQVAAVIGQRFEFDVLREVSGLDEEPVFDAVRAAIDAQLAAEEPESDRESYRFRHALSREAVVADLLSRERRILHRSVGEVLERRGPDRVEELAYHFDEARDARAFRYHVLAAEEATRASAFARAVHHLDRAIELAPDDEPTLGRLYLRLSDMAFASDDLARSLRAAQEAERVSRAAEDPEGQGEALRREARVTWHFGNAGAAAELARSAVALLEPLGPSRALAGSLAELARLAMIDVRADEAVGDARRAVAMAKETSALDIEIDALNTLGAAMANEEGIGLLRTSLALALEHGMPAAAERAYNNLYATLFRTSDEANAVAQVHEESSAHARRFGIRPEGYVTRESRLAFHDGEWDRLLELVDQSRNETTWSAERSLTEAFVRVARDGPQAAIFAAVEGARTRLLPADQQGRAETGRAGLPYLLAGRDREALERADASLESAIASGFGYLGIVGCPAIVAAHRLGDVAALARWTGAILEHGDAPWALRTQRPFARGALARADGRGEEAARLFAEAAAEADRQPPLFFCATLARLARAELLAQASDLEGAAAEVERAKAFWRKVTATWYLAELDRWARERGIPAEARA
ncbi:MAG TPA: hypothetical protein DCK98_03845 [Chloroflexi bacterium]|nr:hypothetical protein [Chloroflexota bacterium]HAL28427.1 hypothetical protein [Chloroflexota bacterium]